MRIVVPPRLVSVKRRGKIAKVHLSTFILAACLACGLCGSSLIAADETRSPASYKVTVQGSAPTARQGIDGYKGTVYIYTGGPLPAFTYPLAFQYLFDISPNGSTTGYLTPVLFEAQSVGQYTVYVVRGFGKSYQVSLNAAPQTIPFEIVEGSKITTNGTFTFGFINALVDSHGTPLAVSEGAVEYDDPAIGGNGEGGPGTTNQWAAGESQDVNIALGTTFGISGSNAAFTLFTGYRTYSALAFGVIVK